MGSTKFAAESSSNMTSLSVASTSWKTLLGKVTKSAPFFFLLSSLLLLPELELLPELLSPSLPDPLSDPLSLSDPSSDPEPDSSSSWLLSRSDSNKQLRFK